MATVSLSQGGVTLAQATVNVTSTASEFGPWFSENSPWRTPIPSDWQNYVHADTASMVQGHYISGTLGPQTGNIHGWAYDSTDMQTKWGSAGLTYMKWAGPGPIENVIYGRQGDTFNTVYVDYPTYKASSVSCPIPLNWTGYNQQTATYFERRTVVVNYDGRVWVLYGLTPPGVTPRQGNGPADSFWHATLARQQQNWDQPIWNNWTGGSTLPHGSGLIIPSDLIGLPVGGWIKHALAINTSVAADGSYTGHPRTVWPCQAGYNGDGQTKTAVGIPHGARVFLDPSLTDTDLKALGCTKEWMLVIARTMQKYGCMSRESEAGQGSAGGIMCESGESIVWNAKVGIPGYGTASAPYQFPWVADGTISAVFGNGTYAAAFPAALMPTSGSHWKVFDWNKSYPGITVAA